MAFKKQKTRKKVCFFTKNKITHIDYKDVDFWHNGLMQVKPCTYNYINGIEKKLIDLYNYKQKNIIEHEL